MRRIKKAEVKRLALCKRGKTGLQTLYKSDGTAEFATLTKGDAEKGELLSVMWPKGMADEDGDFADTELALKSMSSSLIANGGQLDIEHDGKVLPREAARITEVFTIQKSDDRFKGWKDYDGNDADVTGGVAVAIQIDDPDLRAAYRDGDWDGVSLFGSAAVEHVDIKAASQRVAARMGGSMQENEMTNEELQAALAAQEVKFAALLKSAIADALSTKAPKAEGEGEGEGEGNKPEVETAPTFTGDVNDPQALADYEASLRGFELRKAIASGKMSADDIAAMRKSLNETGPTVADLKEAGIDAKDGDAPEVRKLQVQLFKAQKRTNVPTRVEGSGLTEEEELAKSCEAEGLELAKLLNERMGSAPSTGGLRIVNG